MFEITLKFLAAVQKNNSTERLHTYRDLYQQEKKRFSDFVGKLLEECKKLNPSLEDLQVKDCIYRFNKDIRFSQDKKPYKENFWAIFAYGGKKSWRPCFYFHLQPGNKSFVTWWVYRPSQENENKVRAYIIKHYSQRKKLISNKKITSYFQLDEADHQYKSTQKLMTLFKFNPQLLKEMDPELKDLLSVDKSQCTIKWWNTRATELLKHLAYYKDWTFTHPLNDKDVSSPKLFDEMFVAYKRILPALKFFEEAYEQKPYRVKCHEGK